MNTLKYLTSNVVKGIKDEQFQLTTEENIVYLDASEKIGFAYIFDIDIDISTRYDFKTFYLTEDTTELLLANKNKIKKADKKDFELYLERSRIIDQYLELESKQKFIETPIIINYGSDNCYMGEYLKNKVIPVSFIYIKVEPELNEVSKDCLFLMEQQLKQQGYIQSYDFYTKQEIKKALMSKNEMKYLSNNKIRKKQVLIYSEIERSIRGLN